MKLTNYRAFAFAGALVLSGCSFMTDSLIPSLTGEDPAAAATTPAPQAARAAPVRPVAPVAIAQAAPVRTAPASRTPGANGATFTGQKVSELRGELTRLMSSVSSNNTNLQRLRATTVQNSQNYHGTISAINARLQVGTTPGNPILVQQFNKALGELDRINADIDDMNKLTTRITADSTLAAFLSENTRAAFGLSGALDEDHRQLAMLQDEVSRTTVLVERLHQEISEDIRRQTNYVSSERSNLNTLSASVKNGEILGSSLVNRALEAAAVPGGGRPGLARSTIGRRPLVVVRFDRANVAYEQALYNAVSKTLERRPGATFELVAVAPSGGGAARVALNSSKARRNAENVLRALRDMGLPPSRVNVSARTSAAAQSNEVHLYAN